MLVWCGTGNCLLFKTKTTTKYLLFHCYIACEFYLSRFSCIINGMFVQPVVWWVVNLKALMLKDCTVCAICSSKQQPDGSSLITVTLAASMWKQWSLICYQSAIAKLLAGIKLAKTNGSTVFLKTINDDIKKDILYLANMDYWFYHCFFTKWKILLVYPNFQ